MKNKQLNRSIFYLIVVTLILIIFYQNQNPFRTEIFALHPRDFSKFYTSFTGCWLHENLDHISGNLISFVSLSVLFLLLFPQSWLRFFILQYILSSVTLFFLGKPNQLIIGASTWVYSFMAFIITIILLQPNKKLYAILFIAVVFYGSSWWGLLPLLPQGSHEGHISGTIVGILIAIIGKKYWVGFLPKAEVPEWYKKEWNHENPYDKIE